MTKSSGNGAVSGPTAPGVPARVLAEVQFLTWAPSQGGQINTTQIMAASVNVWVNHPEDARYAAEERGAEHAIAVAKSVLAAQRVDVLSIVLARVTQQAESTIINQPREAVVDSGTGMRLVT